ncbi:DUF6973 domain-containing protein [Paenibacillus elgii]|uniref:DUF6973 domain-containing protein n=1 Tax=Paenibacillus elgii TaxID=189691 RepID=UPI000248C65B|nr:hypothetical protein [Paenibacillus elgii]
MKKSLLKKVSVNAVVSIALVGSMSSVALASPQQPPLEVNKIAEDRAQKLSKMTIDEIVADPFYKDLSFDQHTVRFYKEIETFKKNNPHLSIDETVKLFEQKFKERDQFNLSAIWDPYVEKWKELTLAEKTLVVTTPHQALLVDMCRNKAVEYENSVKYGNQHGNGTQRDAFRHAIWNALMCKYIGKLPAYAWATAHEKIDDPGYWDRITDGFTGRQHTAMDLHNNEKGRDCWNIVTDSIIWTSDQTLIDRVIAKIDAGEMIVLR